MVQDPDQEVWSPPRELRCRFLGNSDLTLINYCLTLTSPSEIRQYFRDYLVCVLWLVDRLGFQT